MRECIYEELRSWNIRALMSRLMVIRKEFQAAFHVSIR